MWAKSLKELVFMPVLRRGGTLLAAYMLLGGDWACTHLGACGLVTDSGAKVAAAWCVAAAGVAFDLIMSWANRKSVERKAKAGAA